MTKRLRQVLHVLLLLLSACHPFEKGRVLNHEKELLNVIEKMSQYHAGIYDRDEIDEFLIDDIRNLNIDLIIINKAEKSLQCEGFIESEDSLFVFINKTNGLFQKEKRIIYDNHHLPQNYGNLNLPLASYECAQLNHRWYFVKIGFD